MKSRLKKTSLTFLALAGRRMGALFTRRCDWRSCRRILVFQAGGIGDVIRSFPVILSLHEELPDARLTTLTPFADSVFQLFPRPEILSACLSFNLRGEHRGLIGKWRLAQAIRKLDFDLILNPARGEGMLENAILCFAFGAPHRVGFEKDGAGFLNSLKVPLRDDRSIVEQNLALLEVLGISPKVRRLSIRIPEPDLAFAESFVRQNVPPGERLFALHPGSVWRKELRWPLARYVAFARTLIDAYAGRMIVLGTREEADLTRRIVSGVNSPRVLDLAGRTTLPQVAALLSRSDLFVGNDSGLLHVAIALRVPSIGLFGHTAPRQVICPEGPYVALHKATQDNLYLHQPFFDVSKRGENPINAIEVSDVLQAVNSLLAL